MNGKIYNLLCGYLGGAKFGSKMKSVYCNVSSIKLALKIQQSI